jgi:hypothetical protein
MGIRTQAPICRQHIPFLQARPDTLHPGQAVGQKRRDRPRREHPGAGMTQPQEPRDGNAASRPLHVRLAERFPEDRRMGHRASRAIDEVGAMTLPSPLVQGGSPHGKLIITDGPFMKTTEQLGGYHLVECQDLDEVLALAGRLPMLHVGGAFEVRPVVPASPW